MCQTGPIVKHYRKYSTMLEFYKQVFEYLLPTAWHTLGTYRQVEKVTVLQVVNSQINTSMLGIKEGLRGTQVKYSTVVLYVQQGRIRELQEGWAAYLLGVI